MCTCMVKPVWRQRKYICHSSFLGLSLLQQWLTKWVTFNTPTTTGKRGFSRLKCVCVSNATCRQLGGGNVQQINNINYDTRWLEQTHLVQIKLSDTSTSWQTYKKKEKSPLISVLNFHNGGGTGVGLHSSLLVFIVSIHLGECSGFCSLKILINAASRMTKARKCMPKEFWSTSSPSTFQLCRHPSATAASFRLCACVKLERERAFPSKAPKTVHMRMDPL